jgi:hypothetical protein
MMESKSIISLVCSYMLSILWTSMDNVYMKCHNPTLEEWEDDSFTPKMGTWESAKTPKISKFDCRGQNTLHRSVFYRCRKWACMSHLDIRSTSYDEKKVWESNWQFDSRPLKVRNRPDPGVCRWSAIDRWKALDKGYNFALDLIAIRGLYRKLCALKVAKVLAIGILGLALGSPRTKSHLDVAPMESYKVYYMGEGGGFPRVRAMMSLVSPKSPMPCLSTKGVP